MTAMPPVPSRDAFTSPVEVIVYVPAGTKPDELGRLQFRAHWLTDQPWVPGGVRGQVFHTSLDAFTARSEADGHTVRVVEVAVR